MQDKLGIVAIGRNEGERLVACLTSVKECGLPAVYVDSGSTDQSVSNAVALGVLPSQLDLSKPFTAARARRHGYQALLQHRPSLPYVMFIDGDCEMAADWPHAAVEYLEQNPRVAIVAGRVREKFPHASVYNRMCDYEWNTPAGECAAVGGIFVIRAAAYEKAGGFDPTIPSGEEPELCGRVARQGGSIWRLPVEMARHDAAMTRFGQWWKRQVRTGYGGFDVERRFRLGVFDRLIKGSVFWGGLLPLIAILLLTATAAVWGAQAALLVALAMGLLFLAQVIKIAIQERYRVGGLRSSLEYAAFTMLAKPAILFGAAKSAWRHRQQKPAELIEYKLPVVGEQDAHTQA